MAILLVAANGARPDGRLHVTVLDVGQGDAILLQGPNGGRALVDTGPDPDRLISLLDQRIPAWDRRLDLVVLTHPHEDHVAGVAAVMDRYRIGEIAEPGMIGLGPGDAAYRRRMAELGRHSRILAAGDTLWLDGIRMDVEWPLPGTVPLRPPDSGTGVNNVSIVLDVRFGSRRFVLAGDVEEQIDPQLLAAGIADGQRPMDVLKVAHHGSRTATTDAFIEQTRPRIAVVSAGWGNPYGHPSPATVARIVESGARLFRTDLDGSVEISTNGTDLVANARRRKATAGSIDAKSTIGRRLLPHPRGGASRTEQPGRSTRAMPAANLQSTLMSIPTRTEAGQILRDLDPPDWLLKHSAAVGDIAALLAAAIEEQGHAISRALAESAALLHDVDKAFPDDSPLKGLGHGYAGAEWLSENGFGELAGAVASHPVTRLADDEHWAVWSRMATVEERVVAYADKRAKQDLVSMDERFQEWITRHGDNEALSVARERANDLEAEVCAAAGISPADVERLPWAEAALQGARMTAPTLAYFWGEDAFGLERAADLFADELAGDAGMPLDVWRTSADDEDASEGSAGSGAGRKRARVLEQIDQRLSTGTLFSSGTVVVVRQPGSILREQASREQLLRLLDSIAPGNALAFVDLISSGGRGPAQAGVLRDAIAERGGRVQELAAPSRERMEGWIGTRAKELNATLAPGAAHVLAERVGAYVREGDVDRRRQTELANSELEKLALYRPNAPITREDVEDLVSEAVPGSTWAFLDALGLRRAGDAATLLGRLLNEATPIPVLISQVHRRLRDLIVIREHIDAGTRPPDLIREMKLQPFRAQKLSEQARAWQQQELDEALDDLYELDLLSKGLAVDGSAHSLSDDRSELALLAWLGEHVGRGRGGRSRPTGSGTSAPVGTRR